MTPCRKWLPTGGFEAKASVGGSLRPDDVEELCRERMNTLVPQTTGTSRPMSWTPQRRTRSCSWVLGKRPVGLAVLATWEARRESIALLDLAGLVHHGRPRR